MAQFVIGIPPPYTLLLLPGDPSMSRSRRKSKSYTPSTPEVVKLNPLNENQRLLMESIEKNPITVVNGAAGVGKSCVALYKAVEMYEQRRIDKILYIKPNVDFGKVERGIGFLKGEVEDKLQFLLLPVIDNLEVFCSAGKAKSLIDQKKIEAGLLEHLRGRSLRYTFILADEIQNTEVKSVLTLITRMGEGSKLVISGDTMQCDTGIKNNGLVDALNRLRGLNEVGIINFTKDDIVRNKFLSKVINRYDNT